MPSYKALWSQEFWNAVNPVTLTVGFHKATPGWTAAVDKPVCDFDIWYAAGGHGAVCIDGQWQAYQTGDLLAIKPGSVMQGERTGAPPFQNYYLHVLPFGQEDRGWNERLAKIWPVRMNLLHQPQAFTIFDHLFEAYTTRGDNPLEVRGLTLQLLFIIFQELRTKSTAPPPRAGIKLLRVKELIEARYADVLSLDDLARAGDMTPNYLCHLFKKHLQCTPIEYLVRVRVREAKLLLAKGERCKEAARLTGFRTLAYFSHAFRKRVGLSPTAFAARHARRPYERLPT
ncbi:MAG: AraC family transcriptional regulator [Candidatus Marinimicrobia bacterium]|nr:AraC family transcriptional regulator [Candidatus Neomarinimicrobiota bacterium]